MGDANLEHLERAINFFYDPRARRRVRPSTTAALAEPLMPARRAVSGSLRGISVSQAGQPEVAARRVSSLNDGEALLGFSSGLCSGRCFLYWLIFLSCLGGLLFGYDTGVISGASLLLKERFRLGAVELEAVVSSTILFAALGSLASGPINMRLGRRPTILLGSATFTLGALLMAASASFGTLVLGRVIVGAAAAPSPLRAVPRPPPSHGAAWIGGRRPLLGDGADVHRRGCADRDARQARRAQQRVHC